MGTVGMWTYDILVVINLLGVNVAYTIMCGTMLGNMHLGWFSSSFGSIFLSTIILIIPSLLRNAKYKYIYICHYSNYYYIIIIYL